MDASFGSRPSVGATRVIHKGTTNRPYMLALERSRSHIQTPRKETPRHALAFKYYKNRSFRRGRLLTRLQLVGQAIRLPPVFKPAPNPLRKSSCCRHTGPHTSTAKTQAPPLCQRLCSLRLAQKILNAPRPAPEWTPLARMRQVPRHTNSSTQKPSSCSA